MPRRSTSAVASPPARTDVRAFLAVRPVPYTILPTGLSAGCSPPRDGTRGDRLTYLIVRADGYLPVTTHIFDRESPYLDSDAVFAVKPSLLRDFVPRPGDDRSYPPGSMGPGSRCGTTSSLPRQKTFTQSPPRETDQRLLSSARRARRRSVSLTAA